MAYSLRYTQKRKKQNMKNHMLPFVSGSSTSAYTITLWFLWRNIPGPPPPIIKDTKTFQIPKFLIYGVLFAHNLPPCAYILPITSRLLIIPNNANAV